MLYRLSIISLILPNYFGFRATNTKKAAVFMLKKDNLKLYKK